MTAATLRALPAGLILLAIGKRLPAGRWWWKSALLGVLNIGAFFALLFVAAFRLPGGVAATIGAIQPLFAAGLAALILGERLSARIVLAGGLGIGGIAMLVLGPQARLDGLGIVAALTATACMALGVVLTKYWGCPVSPLTFTAWQLVAGGLFLLPILACTEGFPPSFTARNALGFTWLIGAGTVWAYLNWFKGISALPVATSSALGLLSPVVATMLGWTVLHQSLTVLGMVGGVVALAAVVWITLLPPVRRIRTWNE